MATRGSVRPSMQPAANQLGSRLVGGSTRTTRQLQRGILIANHSLAPSLPSRSAKYGLPGAPRLDSKEESLTACRATGVLSGPAAAGKASAAAVGEGLLRKWLGVAEKDGMPFQQETSPLRDTACDLTICGTTVESKGRKHAVLALVVVPASRSSKPSGGGRKITDLQGPVLHWGCVNGKGDRWQPPPAGWSTWPNVSHDARHGAWQTPFAEQQLPDGTPALTLLLQLPCEGPIRQGGLAFLVKAASNLWLGNAATFSDFFYSTSRLPSVPSDILCSPAASAAEDSGLQGPSMPLDMERLASTPVHSGDVGKRREKQHSDWRGDSNNHNHHHAQEPELPNAGRRAKEPANDETQVCTLTAAELQSAAAVQLAAWLEQQHDLKVPEGALEITQHEWPVKGHPSTPFVAATCALWRKTPGQQREAVLLLAALGDIGLTGKKSPGLVLQWSAVGADGAASVAAKPDAAASGEVTVAALPDGWSTLPDMSWDAGSGFWDTPMTRHLFKPAASADTAEIAGVPLDRPTSPTAAGVAKTQADMYMVLMRLPLQAVFCAGGLLFNMRTSRRQWIRHATTSGPFFLDTSVHAQQLGIIPSSPAPASPAAAATSGSDSSAALNTMDQAAWDVTHAALTAAGLSEAEIVAFAASMPPSGPGLMTPSSQDRTSAASLAAVLSSADAELAAQITKQSIASRDSEDTIKLNRPSSDMRSSIGISGRAGGAESENAAAGFEGGRSGVAKFLREFEPAPLDVNGVTWGLSSEGATSSSELLEIPELTPHHHLVHKIAELEHKASRSLMHRYGIAADLVKELLPDIHAAAKSAPASLTWPPTPQYNYSDHTSVVAKGQMALSGIVAVAVWLRLSALRLLVWNHNYNVKPREISAALHRLGANLIEVYEAAPQLSGVVLLALASAGRGGEGDMGQRIRDEILSIQHRNGCKGGMMEEWHQKLHNNSSPDDLAICQALLDYLAAGQDQQVYWDSLHAAGLTAARLASYDRPIRSQPNSFRPEQVPQLMDDLIAYRRTLAAVHSGADLSAAIDGVLGYDAGECKGKRVKVEPLQGVATLQLRQLLSALLLLVQGSTNGGGSPGHTRPSSPSGDMSNNVVSYTGTRASSGNSPGVVNDVGHTAGSGVSKVSAMMDMERCLKLQALVVAARASLAPHIRAGDKACHGRLRDVLFLDIALELTGRGALEQGLSAVRAAATSTLLGGLLALLQQPLASTCLSALPGQAGNAAMAAMTGQLQKLSQECPGLDAADKARHALSLIERLRSLLAASSATASSLLQPTAWALAEALQIQGYQDPVGPVALLAEEVVRGSAAAALSLLLTAVEPSLRRLAGVAPWSIVSRLPSKVNGKLSPLTACLSQLDDGAIAEPTVLVLQRLAGEEEVPVGVVGVVVLGDCPDVLSHAAVRARNCRIPVVACPSSEEAVVAQLIALEGKHVQLAINGNDVSITEQAPEAAATEAAAAAVGAAPQPTSRQLVSPTSWDGSSWVLRENKFMPGTVGAKAMSAAKLGMASAAAVTGSPSAAASGADFDGALQRLPPWLKVPPSVALPQGAFEKVLAAPENAGAALQLQQLADSIATAEQQGHGASAGDLLHIRSLVQQLQPPAELQQQLQQQLTDLAAASSSSSTAPQYSFAGVWSAVRGVWASQWNDRALAALSKAQLPLQQLRMGVLIQPLLPARYSWVAHTVNPATGSTSEVSVQIVVGLGEVLVGNYPGRALGGIVKRDSLTAALQQSLGSTIEKQELQQLRDVVRGVTSGNNIGVLPPLPDTKELLQAVDVVSHPSKDAAVVPQGMLLPCELGSSSSSSAADGVVFMARSDSNAEDLPGFAGAGLFDSLPSAPNRSVLLDYSKEPLVWDRTAAAGLLWQCALAAVAAEQAVAEDGSESAMGQDIEGCVTADGAIWLLQARPQV